MQEITCPSCNAVSNYDFDDYLLVCPFCSATFNYDKAKHLKEVFNDHFIVPNASDANQIKDLALEWLKRMHHNAANVENEYFVTNIVGYNIPFWVISLEAQTYWKGMLKKNLPHKTFEQNPDYIYESSQFNRSYRWCINARRNIFECWGMDRMHEPKEPVFVDWDGFPLDSTLSRGSLTSNEKKKTPNEIKEPFDFKYSNGLPILGIQIDKFEALRRTKHQVDRYHYKLSRTQVHTLIDYHTELEIAGIQLIHIPIWEATYIYQPASALRHFVPKRDKKLIIDGYTQNALKGELALELQDKVKINSLVSSILSILLIFAGFIVHPSIFWAALIMICLTAYSWLNKKEKKEAHQSNKIDMGNLKESS